MIDAKRYVDRRPELRVEGGILRSRSELLFSGGRDESQLVDGLHKQLGLVRAALADHAEVPVRGALCFVDADWPLIGGDIMTASRRRVAQEAFKLLTQPGPSSPITSPRCCGNTTKRSRERRDNPPPSPEAGSAHRLCAVMAAIRGRTVRGRTPGSLLEGERTHRPEGSGPP